MDTSPMKIYTQIHKKCQKQEEIQKERNKDKEEKENMKLGIPLKGKGDILPLSSLCT